MKEHLQSKTLEEIEEVILTLGEKKFRAKQLYDAITLNKDYSEMTNIPANLKVNLIESYSAKAVEIIEELVSRDKSKKYLFKLNDGNIIEGVFMKHSYGNTLCVSTQVGCRMGCKFCASGVEGLIRHLTAGEILSQVLEVNAKNGGTKNDRMVTNIVLMGSGEPLDNYENVFKFLKLVNSPNSLNISYRNISLSTAGLSDKIIKLADEELPITLSVSLHHTSDETRTQIMPINKRFNIASIIEAVDYYYNKTKRRVSFEYALIKGVNTSTHHAKELANLIKDRDIHVNLIMLNEIKEAKLESALKDQTNRFIAELNKYGIKNTLRQSMGADIAGACGQLRQGYKGDNNN